MNTPILWTLVFHILGIVFWVGALLMTTQVLSLDAATGDSGGNAANSRSASKMMRGMAHPGAAIVIVTGVLLMYFDPSVREAHWLAVKMVFVVVLIALDLWIYSIVRKLPEKRPIRARAAMQHGIISVVFLVILILAVVRPF